MATPWTLTPRLPSSFNDSADFIIYAEGLAFTVGLGFVVPAIVFSFVLIVVFFKYCGCMVTRKKVHDDEEFEYRAQTYTAVASVVVLAIAVIICGVCWSYNNQASQGITSGSNTIQIVITSSANVMLAVNTTAYDFKDQFMQEINKTVGVVGNISAVLGPLNGIIGVVGNATSAISSLTAITIVAANNITAIKGDLTNLEAYQSQGVVSGIPSANQIPNIGTQFLTSLNASMNSAGSVTNIARNLSSTVNATLKQVTATVNDELFQEANEYSEKVDEMMLYLMQFYTKIQSTNSSYNDIAPQVTYYDTIRQDVVIGILVTPIVLSALAALGVIFKFKIVLKIVAAFCFIFMFWYFVIAGVNFAFYWTTKEFCENQDSLVASALSINKDKIAIPGTNASIVVSAAVIGLLKCAGNTTIVDVFNFNFLVDDLKGQIQTELNATNYQVQQLNQSKAYLDGFQDLLVLENNTVNLNFVQNTNLSLVQQELSNITAQLDSVINNPAVNQSLAAVNNVTNNLLLTNGTTIHMYYSSSNISVLNCSVDPYSKLSSSIQEDLCAKAKMAQVLVLARNATIAVAAPINGNISDISQRLYGFQDALPAILYYQNQTSVWANQIQGYLDSAYNSAIGVINNVLSMVNVLAGMIYQEIAQIENSCQCAYVGSAYSALSQSLCTDIRSSLEAIAATMMIGGIVLFATALICMHMIYKMDQEYYEDEGDYDDEK